MRAYQEFIEVNEEGKVFSFKYFFFEILLYIRHFQKKKYLKHFPIGESEEKEKEGIFF